MKTVTLALARMQSIRQLHKYLRAELELPDYYGENLYRMPPLQILIFK